ncbi:hypothetical protein [Dyella tabacisoli]|uniref:Uncharacterized protein n=1 Tax=Dyella tabacisoli TaxID=2282381 RepID=A0A369UMP2_9GAMM|nr:hypothetical protein [Dyella tabacisoli]RDD82034.1 hypothetical protein DVJ77_09640 [Dyella tabacisoli]
MADKDIYEVLVSWQFMPPMEQSVWATTYVLHAEESDGGVGAADAAVLRLRSVNMTRSFRPEPEYEAARANLHMEAEEFAGWYPIAYRMRHGREPSYREPSGQQISEAYERYGRGLCDYY